MSGEENKRHLNQILYREALERKEAQAERDDPGADALSSSRYEPIVKWLRMQERVSSIIDRLNKDLSAIGAAVKVSKTAPREYSSREYPSVGRLRLDFFQDHQCTTRHLEADMSRNGIVHFYMYLPKGTRRSDISVEDLDDDRIEAILLDFVDLATRDDFPRRP